MEHGSMLKRGATRLTRVFLWGASSALLGTMLLAVENMILKPFRMPFQGKFEIMVLGGALMMVLTAGASQQSRIHIAVDILFMRFPMHSPTKLRWILSTLSDVAFGLLFFVVAWQAVNYGMRLSSFGEISETLWVAIYPMVNFVSIGLWGIGMTLSQAFLGRESS
jgi:TRAP-type C4-dicarboxylate transport system permease small subunit